MVENEKVGSVARRKFNEILFGNEHPYGYYSKPEDFDKLNRTVLQNYQKRQYVSNHCVIIVSGLINANTLELLNKNFGDKNWSGGTEAKISTSSMKYTGDKKQYIEKEDALQSAIIRVWLC